MITEKNKNKRKYTLLQSSMKQGHEVKKGCMEKESSLLEAAHISELPSDSGLNEKSNFSADL